MLALALPALMASCSKEGNDPTIEPKQSEATQNLKKVVFTAELPGFPLGDDALRTQLAADGRTVNWNLGDGIAVFAQMRDFDGNALPKHHLSVTKVDGSKITFEGDTEDNAKAYYALYPDIITGFNATNPAFHGDVASPYYVVNLISNQKAILGSFDPNAAISVAKRDADGIFRFKNAAALLKIQFSKDASLDGEDVTEIRLSTANTSFFSPHALAGNFIQADAASATLDASGITAARAISLTNGGQAIAPTTGTQGYYIALAGKSAGTDFVLEFKTSKGNTITKRFKVSTPFTRNKFKSINVTGLGASTETIIEAIDLSGQAGDFEQ